MEAYILNRKKYIKKTDMPITINQQDLPDGAYQAEDGTIVFTKSIIWDIPLKYKAKFIDIFVVGGGAGGSTIADGKTGGKGGGGGGYTNTIKSVELENNEIIVGIGFGGYTSGTTDSGTTYINYNNTNIQAGGAKGLGKDNGHGGAGGSGGGGYGGSGGSSAYSAGDGGQDGNDGGGGVAGPDNRGRGQGTTTRAFGEEGNTLYAGGGGGGASCNAKDMKNREGYGGPGGGGRGATAWYYSASSTSGRSNAAPGTANTGGGGGGSAQVKSHKFGAAANGGSGVALIRLYNRRKVA